MDEATWLACTDPHKMLAFLQGKASERKLRLFACACCRRLWNLLSDKYSRKALVIAERYADSEVSADKLGFAWGDARRAAQVAYRQERGTAEASAMGVVSMVCEADLGRVVEAVSLAAGCEAYPLGQPRLADAQREQSLLLRDVMSNPFCPVSIPPSLLTWHDGTIPKLAQSAYENRQLPSGHLDPALLAILADALEEAGCTSAEVLDHLRSPRPHVRGCWVLDCLLKYSFGA